MSLKLTSTIAICIFITSSCLAQSRYIPPKPADVSDEDYGGGKYILLESRAQIKGEIFAIDYMNFAIAYAKMGQSQDSILYFLQRSKATNEEDFCRLINNYTIKKKPNEGLLYKRLGKSFNDIINGCASFKSVSPSFDFTKYAKENNYNYELVVSLDRIAKLDQKYRSPYDVTLQEPLDRQNQKDVEAIITKWGYPGNSLVGDHYENICWLVIQHADLNYQEKYLPLIHEAVMSKQLPEMFLKMLLDRIQLKKTKTQFFGTQSGIKMADDKTIEEVKSKYSLK